MKRFLLICFLLGFGLLGQAQTTTGNFSYQNRNRTYYVHLPSGYSSQNTYPMVLFLHGLGDNSMNFMNGTGFNAISDQHGFIAVYPDAVDEFGFGQGWNNGTIPFASVDDVGFLEALIDSMSAQFSVNPNRVYASGFSMGGFMCNRLACELSDRIAAIASLSGTFATSLMGSCNPPRAVPAMHMHGTTDGTVSYTGNGGLGTSSVDAWANHWSAHNQCPSVLIDTLPDVANDGYWVERQYYGFCADSTEVLLFKVHGMDHTILGPTNDIDSRQEVWKFFDRHQMTAALSIDPAQNQLLAEISPNPVRDRMNVRLESQSASFRLFDLQGREVSLKSERFAPGEWQLNLGELAPGMYLLQFTSPEGQGQERILKY